LAQPLQRITEKTGALTVPGLFSGTFKGTTKSFSLLSSLVIIFFFVLYIAAQFSGAGKIFNDTFNIDPFWGMVIGSALVTFTPCWAGLSQWLPPTLFRLF
jgi:sodium/proline symporter